LHFSFTLLSTIAISIAASLPAQAQRARVFVSVTGNDANPCTAGSPCKTFQAAHDAVLAGGEISVLDSGGYGTLIINKAVSIVAVGVQASIAIPSNGVGITINAGPSDTVSLRGLTLDGTGVGQDGISFNSGSALFIEGCVVRNMQVDGLVFFSTATQGAQTLAVSNSYFNDNGLHGIFIETKSSGAVTAAIDRTGGYRNSIGLLTFPNGTGAITVGVTDSVFAGNTNGVRANPGQSNNDISLTRVQVTGNTIGVLATGTNATILLAQSTVTGNIQEFSATSNGVVATYGDNYFRANGIGFGALTPATKQ